MKTSFYSHGKLLVTAEYLVLDNVPALALPTKKGQWLHVETNDLGYIHWRSLDEQHNCWFETVLEVKNNRITKRIDALENKEATAITQTLLDIINTAKQLNADFLTTNQGYTITTQLEFNRHWGLGSSSTLINNIAQWAAVNPFTLLNQSFGGSGYDIACAQHDTPILYQRNGDSPKIKQLQFSPAFKDRLFFVYRNQKQNSKDSIRQYRSLPNNTIHDAARQCLEITEAIIANDDFSTFESLIRAHEGLISNIIKTPTVQSQYFSDYKGAIKSLGGWGGDFILTTGTKTEMEYFYTKGYTTIIPYTDMIF